LPRLPSEAQGELHLARIAKRGGQLSETRRDQRAAGGISGACLFLGGEQIYQALRSLGVPTQLVVYPGQFRGNTRLSYQKDRMERYLAWYAKYLKAVDVPATSAAGAQ
jgi:hypothetical protein